MRVRFISKQIDLMLICVAIAINVSLFNGVCYTQIKPQSDVEGNYEFVSHQIDTTKPTRARVLLSPPEWSGMLQISNGFFTKIQVNTSPSSQSECEKPSGIYDFSAGKYSIEGDLIILYQTYAIHPYFRGRPVAMNFKFEGDMLILSQVLTPTLEDMREGTSIMTWKRIEMR